MLTLLLALKRELPGLQGLVLSAPAIVVYHQPYSFSVEVYRLIAKFYNPSIHNQIKNALNLDSSLPEFRAIRAADKLFHERIAISTGLIVLDGGKWLQRLEKIPSVPVYAFIGRDDQISR